MFYSFTNKFFNELITYYNEIRKIVSLKKIIFKITPKLVGVDCELLYDSNGKFSDIKIFFSQEKINESMLTLFEKYDKHFFINQILSGNLQGIPIIAIPDTSLKGKITLNKLIFNEYIKYLYTATPQISRQSKLIEVNDMLRNRHLFFRAFLNALTSNNITKSLFLFVADDSNLKNEVRLHLKTKGFIFYSDEQVKFIVKDLKELLTFFEKLIENETSFIYSMKWKIAPNNISNKHSHELSCENKYFFEFIFPYVYSTKFVFLKQEDLDNIIRQLDVLIRYSDNIKNTNIAFKDICNSLCSYLDDKNKQGNIGERIADKIFIDQNYVPITVNSLQNSISDGHGTGIDQIYEKIDPRTQKKSWIIAEVKTNDSKQGQRNDKQGSEAWWKKNLLSALNHDTQKYHEIINAYNNDKDSVRSILINIDIKDLQKKQRDIVYNTNIYYQLSELNSEGDIIKKHDRIKTRLNRKDFISKVNIE